MFLRHVMKLVCFKDWSKFMDQVCELNNNYNSISMTFVFI